MNDGWILPDFVFDAGRLHHDRALLVEQGRITASASRATLPHARRISGGLCPGFVDLQVNGGGGVLFNSDPTPEGLAKIITAHRAHGTAAVLATVITDAPIVLDRAADAMQAAWGMAGLAGIHIEGPHIDPKRRGTHASQHIRPLDARTIQVVERLRASDIPVLITLAPEAARPDQITALAETGAVVSLGHSNAEAKAVTAALAAGARAFTHLFNAMSQMTSREPGMVGTALNATAYAGIIADGVHVADDMIALACRAQRVADRLFLVSDAMPTLGGPESFHLYDQTIRVEAGRLVNGEGNLAGAHLCMAWAVAHMVEQVGLPLAEVLRMAISTPAEVIAQPSLAELEGKALTGLARLDIRGRYQGWAA